MPRNDDVHTFWEVLERAEQGAVRPRSDLTALYQARTPEQRKALFAAAQRVRRRFFGDRIFLYGFVYTSTYCRNDCTFCYYRRSNRSSLRYRKSAAEIIEISRRLAASGVHLVDLTMGEDGAAPEAGGSAGQRLASLVAEVRAVTALPVMVSPGVIDETALRALADAGASWYACYQETHNPERFSQLRLGQSFRARMEAKRTAHQVGLLIEEGVLCGLGESDADLGDSMDAMAALNADQVRVMTFVPQQGTPLESKPQPSALRELMTIAVLRLAFPERLIPASLDVEGLKGMQDRLLAGANVVTSIVPPKQGLAGVAHSCLDIDSDRRSVGAVKEALSGLGLQVAAQAEYDSWVENRRATLAPAPPRLKWGARPMGRRAYCFTNPYGPEEKEDVDCRRTHQRQPQSDCGLYRAKG